jgi:hypothetical protein
MPEDLVVEANGPYLRIVLPDFEPDWAEVWSAVDFELEEGIERAEVIAPCYPDDHSLAVVREVVEHLERCHVETVVEWQGRLWQELERRRPQVPAGPGQVPTGRGTNDP